ncbi:MAG: ABC transporter ATP-binding protein/permease, partial [Clostridiales bacterium]|nr:ABC transporter ATP-binding protein/permease [Clostridiales bacterium]
MHPKRQIYTGEKVDMGVQLSRLTGHSKDMVLPFIVAILFACAGVVLTIIGPNQLSKITQYIIDGIAAGINMEAIARTALFLLGLYVLSAIFSFLQHFILATVTLRLSNRLRADIFDKVNRAPMKLFGRIPYGDILSRMTNDVNTLVQSLSNSLPSMVSAAAQFIGCLVMMFITEWHMSIAAVGATLLGFALMGLIMSRSQKYFLARQTSLGQLNGYVEEMYSGHDVVRISRAEKKMKSAFDRLNKEVYQANRKSQFISGIMQPLMGFVGNLGYVAVCIYGSKLAMDGVIDFGVIVAFIMYVRLFTSPLSTFAQGMTQMQSAAAAGKRVFDFLEEEELEDESGKESYTAQVKGQVEFKNLRFGYSEDRKNAVIKDFSASVKPGQKIAIVGPTGAGKTTIVNLLMRFYELWGGSILIDGVPTAEMKREDVHSLFSMVLQDTWMFQGTVRENLVFNCQQVPDEEIEKACRACGIWDFVESLPEGLDTVLTENTSISAGQKQLFTIARAMIQNRPMLILDEATSSVDTRTELMTQKAMDELMKDRTCFV